MSVPAIKTNKSTSSLFRMHKLVHAQEKLELNFDATEDFCWPFARLLAAGCLPAAARLPARALRPDPLPDPAQAALSLGLRVLTQRVVCGNLINIPLRKWDEFTYNLDDTRFVPAGIIRNLSRSVRQEA